MTIVVTPSDDDVPLIRDIQGTPSEIRERAEAAFKTAEFLEMAGAHIDVTDKDRKESREIFTDSPVAPKMPTTSASAYHLKALLNEYDYQLLDSNIQARNYIVNRLIDISNPYVREEVRPDGTTMKTMVAKHSDQLKALELLGKVSEIGLFTERIEVSINDKSTEELEKELVNTLVKYMGEAVPVKPVKKEELTLDLDDMLAADKAEAGKKQENKENLDDA